MSHEAVIESAAPNMIARVCCALGLAVVAVYGPFVVMAIVAQFSVSCRHCMSTVWGVLPFAPGLIIAKLPQVIDWQRRGGDLDTTTLATLMSIVFVMIFAVPLFWGGRVRRVAMIFAAIMFSLVAFGLLAAIRA